MRCFRFSVEVFNRLGELSFSSSNVHLWQLESRKYYRNDIIFSHITWPHSYEWMDVCLQTDITQFNRNKGYNIKRLKHLGASLRSISPWVLVWQCVFVLMLLY